MLPIRVRMSITIANSAASAAARMRVTDSMCLNAAPTPTSWSSEESVHATPVAGVIASRTRAGVENSVQDKDDLYRWYFGQVPPAKDTYKVLAPQPEQERALAERGDQDVEQRVVAEHVAAVVGERRPQRGAVPARDRDRRGLVEPQAPGRDVVQAQGGRERGGDRDGGDRQ